MHNMFSLLRSLCSTGLPIAVTNGFPAATNVEKIQAMQNYVTSVDDAWAGTSRDAKKK